MALVRGIFDIYKNENAPVPVSRLANRNGGRVLELHILLLSPDADFTAGGVEGREVVLERRKEPPLFVALVIVEHVAVAELLTAVLAHHVAHAEDLVPATLLAVVGVVTRFHLILGGVVHERLGALAGRSAGTHRVGADRADGCVPVLDVVE